MKTRFNSSYVGICLAVLLVATLLLPGCAVQNSNQDASGSASASVPSASVIIELANDADAELLVGNDTGTDVTAVAIRAVGTADFSKNLMATGDIWADGELALIRYHADKDAASGAVEAAPESASESAAAADSSAPDAILSAADGQSATDGGEHSPLTDAELKQLYDVQLTFADGNTAVLHFLNLSTLEEPLLRLEGDFAYLSYSADGAELSTLEAEKAVRAADEAAAQAAAEQAAAEAAAAAAAEAAAAENAEYDAYGYDYGYDYGYGGNAGGGGGSAPNQSADNCLGDVLIN